LPPWTRATATCSRPPWKRGSAPRSYRDSLEIAEVGLGPRVALLRSLGQPLYCSPGVLRHALTRGVGEAKVVLTLGVTGLGGPAKPPHGFRNVGLTSLSLREH